MIKKKSEKAANCHIGCAATLQTFTLHYSKGNDTLMLLFFPISC